MDTTLSALGVGRSGRAALWHLGLACAAGGAVLEALTIAAPCAATEWLEDDDDSNASARAGTAIVVGQIIGAVGWAAAADFLGRREAIVLACVGATGTCAVAACASTPFAFEVGVAVCAASATRKQAEERRARTGASAEDMEAFGVALACRLHRARLTVIRGVSNHAGDRDAGSWRIGAALEAAHRLALEILTGE